MCNHDKHNSEELNTINTYTSFHISSIFLVYSLCGIVTLSCIRTFSNSLSWGRLNIKTSSYQYRISIIKMQRSDDRCIFIMEISIPGKTLLYWKEPWNQQYCCWPCYRLICTATSRGNNTPYFDISVVSNSGHLECIHLIEMELIITLCS